MGKNRLLLKNLVASILTYGLSFCISFFLSPYITRTLGVEANGFVTLANQFVGYISLITVALTSMASRFISISIFKKDFKRANIYFNSVIGASAILVVVLSFLMMPVLLNLQKIINIKAEFIVDVKILFALVFINFCLGLLLEVFSIATYVTNRLYLNSLRSIEGTIMRCVLIVGAYALFEAKMYFVSVAALFCGLYTYLWNIHYTKKYLPEMSIQLSSFRWDAIKELLSAGSWNIVIQLNNILNTGLDLLLSNLILGETPMGILAVAKTIPTAVSTMLNSVSGVFFPELTQLYAENNMDGFTLSVKRSIKILSMIFNIPVVFLMAFGSDFYRLWQPSLDSRTLQVLSLMTICTILVSGSTATVFGIFTITNKLRFHSLSSLVCGFANVVIVIGLLNFVPHSYGMYIVAGVSSVLIILRNYFVTFPYAAKCIGQRWYVFHIPSFVTVLGAVISACICSLIRIVFVPGNWITLILCGVLAACISMTVNAVLVLSKNDRQYLRKLIKKRIDK